MSLRARMGRIDEGAKRRQRFERYGIIDNPFPAAGQPSGHPRMEDAVDDRIEDRVRQFETDARPSQVLVVEGIQGVGKTNLLNYYEQQFREYYGEDETFYIIRYYPDPEPSFDSVLRKIFQSLDQSHFEKMSDALATSDGDARNEAKDVAKNHEVRIVLNSLERVGGDDEKREECARLALEWFVGLRVLKRHREVLGVSFRLDTVESRTQALRDMVYVSERLGLLKGILLMLDELEKQDYSLSKTPVLRFLSAIRALIDALPSCLFLMLAMTRQARRRYFAMFPALEGRLQDAVTLEPIHSFEGAKELSRFYIEQARHRARMNEGMAGSSPGSANLFGDDELKSLFEELQARSRERGIEGVTQRDLLHRLHDAWGENSMNA